MMPAPVIKILESGCTGDTALVTTVYKDADMLQILRESVPAMEEAGQRLTQGSRLQAHRLGEEENLIYLLTYSF